MPKNNSLAFFEVTEKSFHQVAEVLTKDKQRLSVGEWKNKMIKEYVGKLPWHLTTFRNLWTTPMGPFNYYVSKEVGTKSDFFKPKSETHLKEIVYSFNYHELRR